MRAIIFLTLIALFCLPVLANQEDVLPFVYVTTLASAAYQYDMFVMDARSGEGMYSVIGEDYDCPYSISEDRNWLLYSQNSNSRLTADNFIMNLNTGESASINVSRAWWVMGNHDFSQIASIQWDYRNWDARLNVLPRSRGYPLTVTEDEGGDIFLMRFVGDDLLFVRLEDDAIIFNRWNGTSLYTRLFSRWGSDNISLDISADGNFLKVLYPHNGAFPILSILDTRTGDAQDIILPRLGVINYVAWMPNSNSFAYISNYGGVWFYDTELGEVRELLAEEEELWYSDLHWSPDASYMMFNQSYETGVSLRLIDMSSGIVSGPSTFGDVWDVEWLSTTEFVYDFAEFDDVSREFDIFYYNASTGEERQLTDTDELNETLYCGWG
jgi:hypothetical protein